MENRYDYVTDMDALPPGVERGWCPRCGLFWCPTYIQDFNRHRELHSRIVERRSVYGEELLSPDQQFRARKIASTGLAGQPDQEQRLQLLLLMLQSFYSYSILDKGEHDWQQHPDFNEYVTWFIGNRSDFFNDNLRDYNGRELHRALEHALKTSAVHNLAKPYSEWERTA